MPPRSRSHVNSGHAEIFLPRSASGRTQCNIRCPAAAISFSGKVPLFQSLTPAAAIGTCQSACRSAERPSAATWPAGATFAANQSAALPVNAFTTVIPTEFLPVPYGFHTKEIAANPCSRPLKASPATQPPAARPPPASDTSPALEPPPTSVPRARAAAARPATCGRQRAASAGGNPGRNGWRN